MIHNSDRRAVMIGAGAVCVGAAAARVAPALSQSTAPPQDLGFAADLAEKLDAGIRSGLLRGLHSVVVVRSASRCWSDISRAKTRLGGVRSAASASGPTRCMICAR